MTQLDDRLRADGDAWRSAVDQHQSLKKATFRRPDSVFRSWLTPAAVAVAVGVVVAGTVVGITHARRSPTLAPATAPATQASVAPAPTSTAVVEAGLTGVSWQLVQLVTPTDAIITPAASHTYATVDFDGHTDISGYDGCNEFNGTTSISGGSVTISAATEGGFHCNASNPLPGAMSGLLTGTWTWIVQTGTLTLSKPGAGRFVFAPPPPAASTPAPADTDGFPAKGCSAPTEPVVTITINPDGPQPDCVAISPSQHVKVFNNTNGFAQKGGSLTATLGHQVLRDISPGSTEAFAQPVGSFLALGEHVLKAPANSASNIVIWVR